MARRRGRRAVADEGPSRQVRFTGPSGATLAGRVDRPEEEPAAWALFAHCFTCGKDIKSLGRIARTLVEHGVGVLRFDFTGIGASEGEFAGTTFSSNLDDVVAAADFMRRTLAAPSLLLGHSLGGAAVLAAARRVPEARAVAVIAAPSDTTRFRDTLRRRFPELEQDGGEADVDLGSGRYRISRALLDDLARHDLAAAAGKLGKTLLVFHSPDDRTVPIAEGEALFAAAAQPKAFIALPGADHLLLERPGDARFVGDTLAAWLRTFRG